MVQAGAGCVLYVNNVPSKGWLVWENRTLTLATSLERGDGLPFLLSGNTVFVLLTLAYWVLGSRSPCP